METILFIDYLKHRISRRRNSLFDTKPIHSFLHTIERDMPILEQYKSGEELYTFMLWNYSPRHIHDIEDIRKAYAAFCIYRNASREELGK